MLINLYADADAARTEQTLRGLGLWTQRLADDQGQVRSLRIVAPSPPISADTLSAVPGVQSVLSTQTAHPLVDAQAGRPVSVGNTEIGGDEPALIAGPCSAESAEQVFAAAELAANAGAQILRGGAYKPRTSPYSFRGHGPDALVWLREAADRHGMALVTEVMSELDVERVGEVADMIQVGSRNMQNFALLRAVGLARQPVLLKRGQAATVKEWLLAAEHALDAGASQVVFCERGIRGFDVSTRNLLDLASVALLKHVHGQPVIVDPSHGCGRRDLVTPMAKAAYAAGADGVMVEVHPHPESALSDGAQALTGGELKRLASGIGVSS